MTRPARLFLHSTERNSARRYPVARALDVPRAARDRRLLRRRLRLRPGGPPNCFGFPRPGAPDCWRRLGVAGFGALGAGDASGSRQCSISSARLLYFVLPNSAIQTTTPIKISHGEPPCRASSW
jgi:hypothetical protein